MQRYFSNKIVNNHFVINEDDMYHIKKVMRYKENDKVEIVYENELYIGLLDKEGILNKEKIETTKEKNTYIRICIPLLKETKMDYILQKSCELGVDEIVPVLMDRSIIKIDDREDKKLTRWMKIVKEASEQSKRLDIPKIEKIKNITELNYQGLKLICSTNEKENTIKKVLQKNIEEITFVIGPEGGITDIEEEKLVSIGYQKITLGNRIMRVETVPLFLLSVINYVNME